MLGVPARWGPQERAGVSVAEMAAMAAAAPALSESEVQVEALALSESEVRVEAPPRLVFEARAEAWPR